MGRIKQGLDYFPLNTDFMHDRVVRRVMKREGDSVFTILLYTLSYLYSGEGYYIHVDDDFYDELEEVMIMGDMGVRATEEILDELKDKVKAAKIKDPEECRSLLIETIKEKIDLGENAYDYENQKSALLIIGVNGVGKTTSVGKLAASLKSKGKKVILYAPTWRESTDGGASCDLKPPIDLDKWKERLGKDCVVFIRAHVNTREMLGIKYDDVIRNGSDYPAVNDLLMMADFLISDYSSIIMDYCILGRPIVCFGYDYEEYNKARGGFYFDLDKEIPSGVRHTEDDVPKSLMRGYLDMYHLSRVLDRIVQQVA